MNFYCAKIAHFLKRGTNLMKTNLITTALLLSASAFVQAETKTELEPINVYSAYATPVNQDQTASSVTVLTEKDFAERNATYVSDVLKTVPGVAMTSHGGRGTETNFYVRGAEPNQAIVVIDGVKMNPISGDAFNLGGLTLSNIERIEVLRGEQSALWGSDAMGGVIYITTKSGLYKEKPFNIDFDLGTGSYRTRDGSVTLSGYNGGFYYSLHGDSHRTSGISSKSSNKFNYTSTSGTKFSTGGYSEKDKFHRDNASLRFGYDDNNKGIELFSSHSSQTSHFDDNDRPISDETLFNDNVRTRESIFKLSGYFGNDKELFKHKVNISHIKTTRNVFDLTPYSANIETKFDARRLNANYQLDINFDQDGAITQGMSFLAEYQKAKYEGSEYTNTKENTEKSIATEYRLLHEDGHNVAVSGRYIKNSFYDNTFTSRISGGYRLSPNFKAHTSFGTATKSPTISEYFGYAPWTNPNFDLKAEKSRGGDIGLLIETTDRQHSLDITYFARNVKDLISYDGTTSKNKNVSGTSQIRGVELAYSGKLTTSLTSYANYTYTQARDNKKVDLSRRPKHAGNIGLAYKITEKLGADANISYVGKRIDTFPMRTQMPSYTLANIGMNYQIVPNLTIYANLNNVFNKKYENVLGYGQDGRNVYVGLKGSF